MKSLILKDQVGNRDDCVLALPDGMDRWNVGDFLHYLQAGPVAASEAGFLPVAPDDLRLESFRQLILDPQSTGNPPVTLCQRDAVLCEADSITLDGVVTTLDLGRLDQDPDWSKVSVQTRNQRAFADNRDLLVEVIDGLLSLSAKPIIGPAGQPIESLGELVTVFDALATAEKVGFFLRVSEAIHAAPFENLSKLIAGRQFRSGVEMVLNLRQGFGGVCAEKTAALKFICDVLGVVNRPVLGATDEIPDQYESCLTHYVQSGGSEDAPLEIQHHMLEVDLDGSAYLIDVTGGKIPMLFLDAADADRLIAGGYRARMVYRTDRLHLARVSPWVGDVLLTLSEYHVPDLHMQYVFGQGLGLWIDAELFVGVYFDWGGQASAVRESYFAGLARRVRFPYPRFIHEANLHATPDARLARMLHAALDALRSRYHDERYTGDFTFVIQPLKPNFWVAPRISESVRATLGSCDLDDR